MNTGGLLIALVIAILFAFACRTVAGNKGRGTTLWTVLGFFFGLIALIIIAILPKRHT